MLMVVLGGSRSLYVRKKGTAAGFSASIAMVISNKVTNFEDPEDSSP